MFWFEPEGAQHNEPGVHWADAQSAPLAQAQFGPEVPASLPTAAQLPVPPVVPPLVPPPLVPPPVVPPPVEGDTQIELWQAAPAWQSLTESHGHPSGESPAPAPRVSQHCEEGEQLPERQSLLSLQGQTGGESNRSPPGTPQQTWPNESVTQLDDRQSALLEQEHDGSELCWPFPLPWQPPEMGPASGTPASCQKVGAMPHTQPASSKASTQAPVQHGASAPQGLPVGRQMASGPASIEPASVGVGAELQPRAAAPRIRDVVQLTRMASPSY